MGVSENQFSFMPGRPTMEAIFSNQTVEGGVQRKEEIRKYGVD